MACTLCLAKFELNLSALLFFRSNKPFCFCGGLVCVCVCRYPLARAFVFEILLPQNRRVALLAGRFFENRCNNKVRVQLSQQKPLVFTCCHAAESIECVDGTHGWTDHGCNGDAITQRFCLTPLQQFEQRMWMMERRRPCRRVQPLCQPSR